jgi:Tol biopolymer transport system component
VDGGEEMPLMAGPITANSLWTLRGSQLIHVTNEEDELTFHVEVLDLDTGKVNRIFSTDVGVNAGMTVSPDGRWVVLSMSEPEQSDIMLVEGFR